MSKRFQHGVSLQTRITAAAMATAVGVLVIACGLFTLEQWGGERAAIIQVQKRVGETLAPRIADAIRTHDTARANRILADMSIAPRLVDATLLDDQGHVFARYRNADPKASVQTRLLEFHTPVVIQGRSVGMLILHNHVEPAGSFLPRYLALTGALFFAATAISLFLGRLLAQRIIEPVGRLSEVMGEVAVSGDLSRRVKRGEEDEFGRLTDSFNALLDRLQSNQGELRETMDALVIARDDAEAANLQKSQFLANMSHEIRTPLNGVLAMTQIMALGGLTDEQRGRLDIIKSSGEALLVILNDILDVSKIEAGKLELEIVEFDPDQLARGAVSGFAAVADAKGLALTLDVTPQAQGPRMGDPARIRQIVANLISNALKFTQAGSVALRVEGLGERGDEGLRLVVADTGMGMPEDKLPYLFQKFTQLDASTTRRFGGTGLGLSICRELTAKMDGEIRAESVEGAGSTFFVDLPLPRAVTAAVEDRGDEALPEDQGRPLRILAAEDNATNQLVLSTILDIFGAELLIVENGRLAVEAWATGDFDVILMDIQMPEMDGITAAREIRAAEAASNRSRIPIVALSANAMSHQVAEYMAAGMDGHVAKPIELNKLHAALEMALEARTAAAAAAA